MKWEFSNEEGGTRSLTGWIYLRNSGECLIMVLSPPTFIIMSLFAEFITVIADKQGNETSSE